MLYLIVSAVILLLDQYVKKLVVSRIALGERAALIPGFIRLTYVQNYGAAFNILQNMRFVLLGVTIVFLVGLAVVIVKGDLITKPAEKWCVSLVVGGAMGNAVDRALLGYVVDMFELEFINFAIFNVADCFIVAGGTLFIILTIASYVGERREHVKAGDENGVG